MEQDDFDMRDLLLEAQAEFAEIVMDLMKDLSQVLIAQQVKMKWASLTPEQKEMMKAQDPETYARVESLMTTK